MHARNRRNGAEILGTLETLPGPRAIRRNSWQRDPAGNLSFKYEPQNARTTFLDATGQRLTEDDVELHEVNAPLQQPSEDFDTTNKNTEPPGTNPTMRCCNCGSDLRPRDAKSFDGLPLSESERLGHRDTRICNAMRRNRAKRTSG